MAGTDTFIFRAALQGRASIYRDIELDPAKSLYVLAEAIVSSFNFDFDHAFGFYTGLTPAKLHKTFPIYELFADMGDADPRVLGVKKTKISQAFPEVGHTMLFLFDYGDGWLFRGHPAHNRKEERQIAVSAHRRNSWRGSCAIPRR